MSNPKQLRFFTSTAAEFHEIVDTLKHGGPSKGKLSFEVVVNLITLPVNQHGNGKNENHFQENMNL